MDSNQKSPSPPKKKAFMVPMGGPLARKAAQGRDVGLPPVTAPSLEGLSVTVPAPARITAEQIQERFKELAREHAVERMRSRTEKIAWEDEVLLNLAGFCEGRLIPFSARVNLWMPLSPASLMPGLYEQLVGRMPGEAFFADIVLSPDYPIDSVRGRPARFVVLIQAAREVTYADPASPELLKALGRGNTLAQASLAILKELEQESAQMLRLQGQNLVLAEVAARTQVDIPAELIDEEIRRRWGTNEGQAVVELKFNVKQQEESLNGWLGDAQTRAEAGQRLRISLALGAICQRDGITLTEDKLREVIQSEANALGVTLEQAAAALRAEPQQFARIEQMAWHLLAVDYVMGKAQVRYQGA